MFFFASLILFMFSLNVVVVFCVTVLSFSITANLTMATVADTSRGIIIDKFWKSNESDMRKKTYNEFPFQIRTTENCRDKMIFNDEETQPMLLNGML